MGGFHRTTGTRGRRRGEHLLALQQEQQRLALDPGDAHMGDTGSPMRTIGHTVAVGRRGLHDVGDGGQQPIEQSIAQCSEAGAFRLALGGSSAGRHGHGHDAGDVLGPRSTTALLASADLHGMHRCIWSGHERTDALRTTELVAADGHQIGISCESGDVGPAERLHGVGVQQSPGSVTTHELRHAVERLDGSDLVVDGHHRDESDSGPLTRLGPLGLLPEHLAERVEIDAPCRIHTDDTSTEMLDGIEHRMVLDRTAHDDALSPMPGLGLCEPTGPEHREVVGLGTTTGVDDVARSRPQQFGQFVTGLIDGTAGIAGPPVGARGVGEAFGEHRQHRLDRVGPHRPRRRMVEICAHPPEGTGGGGQTVAVTDDASLYGDSFADVYDEWYADMFDTDAEVTTLIALAGDGPVCELGVGTGRLAIPLAAAGLEVVGLDASAAMLDRLRAKEPPPTLTTVLGDMAAVADVLSSVEATASHRFPLVFCAFNTFLNLSSEAAQQRCMHQVASLLSADGIFVVESFVPAQPSEIETESVDESWVGNGVIVHISTDPITQMVHGEHLEPTDAGLRRRRWTARYLHPEQFDELAAHAGLTPIHRWSDWRRSPFDEHSDTHITVYRRI